MNIRLLICVEFDVIQNRSFQRFFDEKNSFFAKTRILFWANVFIKKKLSTFWNFEFLFLIFFSFAFFFFVRVAELLFWLNNVNILLLYHKFWLFILFFFNFLFIYFFKLKFSNQFFVFFDRHFAVRYFRH